VLVAVGARGDALRSGFVTYRAAVAAISREVSDPSAGYYWDAFTIICHPGLTSHLHSCHISGTATNLETTEVGRKRRGIAGNKTMSVWMWNGSPESFFHPRDVDWEAIASSGGIWGILTFFLWGRSICPEATQSSMGASERSKWSEDAAFEQARGPFFRDDVWTRGIP
jgi:hypothetical protein